MTDDPVLRRLVAWAEAEPAVRALLLESSRAHDDGSVDRFSDYDVVVAVDDAARLADDDSWTHAYARPLARWGDEHELYGLRTYFRGVVYEDNTKIDWTVWPAELLERVAEAATLPDLLDTGYRVLVDKDGATVRWPKPTYRAHIPSPPSAGEYRACVEEFWWTSTYVAKALHRGELFFAKFVLDYDLKFNALRRMLEWRIELDHDWSLRPGVYGRGIERLLPAEVVAELHATWVGAGIDDNWNALFRLTALFRRVATDTGEALGFEYPLDLDGRMTQYLQIVREL